MIAEGIEDRWKGKKFPMNLTPSATKPPDHNYAFTRLSEVVEIRDFKQVTAEGNGQQLLTLSWKRKCNEIKSAARILERERAIKTSPDVNKTPVAM